MYWERAHNQHASDSSTTYYRDGSVKHGDGQGGGTIENDFSEFDLSLGGDFSMNQFSGLFTQIGTNTTGFDRIRDSNKRGTRLKEGFALDGIKKGILYNNANFKTNNHLFKIGSGNYEFGLKQLESFINGFSGLIEKELSGYGLGHPLIDETVSVNEADYLYLNNYSGNTITSAKDINLHRGQATGGVNFARYHYLGRALPIGAHETLNAQFHFHTHILGASTDLISTFSKDDIEHIEATTSKVGERLQHFIFSTKGRFARFQ